VAGHLLACLRDCDTVARLGGDEFAILLPAVSDSHSAVPVAQRILEAISKPFIFCGRECPTTASIGISLYPAHGENAEALLSSADSAMYRAKERRNCYALSRPGGEVRSS
jgi:diguanylate cyclase (GGDEF)-like protein